MRTTIDIPDAMYRRLKARAAADGRPAKALILRGVLRLLASEAVMGEEVLSQVDAWAADDRRMTHGHATLLEAPPGLERRFRQRTRSRQATPKAWADSYLAAFAETSQVTLVTLDRAFRGKVAPLMLLPD